MISVEQIILLIIFLIAIFLVVFLLVGGGKLGIDKLLLQNELRQCCQAYRSHGCPDRTTLSSILLFCNDKTILELIDELEIDKNNNNLNQTRKFCGCS
ncbi:MAG: hypothetical protein QW076_02930 [Candidatus Anstonellales archaeon]